jgi:thiol-disulfide isomerase/thioredoxin
MRTSTRRAALLGLGAAAAGTVAVASLLRKPPPPVVFSPVAEPEQPTAGLQPITALVETAQPAPPADVVFQDGGGASFHLSEFAGSGLVVNLWATWCVPCVVELPTLAALRQKLTDDKILVLALSVDRGGAPVVENFLASHHLDLQVWLDPKGEATRAWGARGIPTTLIIDRNGLERGRLEGSADWASAASVARIKALVG